MSWQHRLQLQVPWPKGRQVRCSDLGYTSFTSFWCNGGSMVYLGSMLYWYSFFIIIWSNWYAFSWSINVYSWFWLLYLNWDFAYYRSDNRSVSDALTPGIRSVNTNSKVADSLYCLVEPLHGFICIIQRKIASHCTILIVHIQGFCKWCGWWGQ